MPVLLRVLAVLTDEERRVLGKVGSPSGVLGVEEKREVEAMVEKLYREQKIQLVPVSGEGVLVPDTDVCARAPEPAPKSGAIPIPRLTVLKGGVA